MYNIGDRVVYPMHGAGVIEAIEEKKFLSEKQKYYVMRMPIGEMKVMIPVNNCVEIGIREVIGTETAEAVVKAFAEMSIDMNSSWNRRYRENMLKLKTGDILEVAYVVKSLMLRDKMRGLSTGERKMLSNSKQILVSELVLAGAALDSEEILEYFGQIVEEQLATKTYTVDGDTVVAAGIVAAPAGDVVAEEAEAAAGLADVSGGV